MINFEDKKAIYTKRWNECVINADKLKSVTNVFNYLCQARKDFNYDSISAQTGVPWYVIGMIHNMEASFRPNIYLHNGDSLFDQDGNPIPTVHVPEGVGPFNPQTFENAAVHSLQSERFTGVTDWSIEHILYLLEGYNGYGYWSKLDGQGNPATSAYLWSYSNQYVNGGYPRDHVYDPKYVSDQVGCACVLKLVEKNGLLGAKPVDLPPSNPHQWDASTFFRKMDEYFTQGIGTLDKYNDLQYIWPKAKLKIQNLLNS